MNSATLPVFIVLVVQIIHLRTDCQERCSCYTFKNGTNAFGFLWPQANASCEYNKKHLVVLETEREWEFINKEIQARKAPQEDEWHIGLYRNIATGKWIWINGKPLTIQKWQRYKPEKTDSYTLIAKEYPKGHYGSFRSIQGNVPRGWICEEETDNCQGVCFIHNPVPTNSTPVETSTATTHQIATVKSSTAYDHTNGSASVPSQPRDVTAELVNNAIVVTWKEPEDRNGIRYSYKVYCEGRRDYNSSFKVDTQVVEAVSSRRTVIKKEVLRPGTNYSVYVKATTSRGDGVGSDPVVLEIPSEAPPPPRPPRLVGDDVTPTTITISLTRSTDNNGKVIFHHLIVDMLALPKACKRETTFLPNEIFGYKKAQENCNRFYIAAQFERGKLPDEFILGNGKMYGGYENAPLKPETQYKVYLRAATERYGKWMFGNSVGLLLPHTGSILPSSQFPPVSTSGTQKYSVGWVIAVYVEGFFLVLLTAIIVFGYVRMRQLNAKGYEKNEVSNEDDYEMVDAVADASRQLGSSLDEDTNNEGRTNRQAATQGEYAMLNKSTMQGNDRPVYTALVKPVNTDDQELHLDASAAKFDDNTKLSSQNSGRRPTYENVSKTSAVYMND